MNQRTIFSLGTIQDKLADASIDLENLLIALRAIETDDPKSQAIKIALDIALTNNAEIVSKCAYRVTILVEEDEVGDNYYE